MINPAKKDGKILDPNDEKLEKDADHVSADITADVFDITLQYLSDDKEIDKKLIGYLEKCVRNSYEYRQYIEYLKSDLDITRVTLMPQIDTKDIKVSLEFHHCPLTLFDICDIISREMLKKAGPNGKVSLIDIMSEIVREHYAGLVGLVPLTTTLHEMVHTKSIVVPWCCIYGDVDRFLSAHKDSMDAGYIQKICDAKAITMKMATETDFDKLHKTVLDYNVSYSGKQADAGEIKSVSDLIDSGKGK